MHRIVGNTMTGQEWYDRFHEELLGMFGEGLEVEDREYHSVYSVLSAAKKAAGLGLTLHEKGLNEVEEQA
jgi:hypothetical protein